MSSYAKERQRLAAFDQGGIRLPRSKLVGRTIEEGIIEERWVKVTFPSRRQPRSEFT